MKKGKIIGDAPCPSCRAEGGDSTGNHLILFEDGGAYCNRCGHKESPTTRQKGKTAHTSELVTRTPIKDNSYMEDILSYPFLELQGRGISKLTAEYFGVRSAVSVSDGTTQTHHYFPYYSRGKLQYYKVRALEDKKMFSTGNTKDGELFGQHLSSGSKTVYVTEGEYDALALWQCLKENSSLDNWNPTVVSIPHGAAHAAKAVAESYEFLNSFDRVVFIMDNDDAGRKALKECSQVMLGKAYYVDLPLKDPNDMLLAGRGEELKWLCMKPKEHQPDNIINGADAWDLYKSGSDIVSLPYPESWRLMNQKTYGVRYGSVVTVSSGTGCGKTQFLRELKYHYFQTTDDKMADISLEESLTDSMQGIMSLHLNKRMSLPDVETSEEEEKNAFEYLYDSGRWSFYDHFGGMDDDNLFSKLRYFAATGHRFIFIDHLSIIVSEFAAQGGERERIDTIMTRLAKIAKEFNIVIFLVVHLRKGDNGKAFEEGVRPTVDDLRGSGTIKQLSWDIIFLTRNQQHPNPVCANTVSISIGKCRFTGRTGEADYLYFDERTGRLRAVDKPEGWDLSEQRQQERRGNLSQY